MVKKVKRFIVFVLFSLFFQLLHGRTQTGTGAEQGLNLIPSAEAKCCPAGSNHLDSNGGCCKPDQTHEDENGNCY